MWLSGPETTTGTWATRRDASPPASFPATLARLSRPRLGSRRQAPRSPGSTLPVTSCCPASSGTDRARCRAGQSGGTEAVSNWMMNVPPPDEDEQVPAFWQALGLPGLIDVHVHFMPSWLLQRVWAHFDAAGPLVGLAWPIRYRWSDDERVAYLRRL